MKGTDVKVPIEDKDLFLQLFGEEVKKRPFSPDRRGSKSRHRARRPLRQFLVFTIHVDQPQLHQGWRIIKRNKR